MFFPFLPIICSESLTRRGSTDRPHKECGRDCSLKSTFSSTCIRCLTTFPRFPCCYVWPCDWVQPLDLVQNACTTFRPGLQKPPTSVPAMLFISISGNEMTPRSELSSAQSPNHCMEKGLSSLVTSLFSKK